MGDLEWVFLLPLQRLQIELALERDLILDQPRGCHHLQDQWQQQSGVITGAFEADQGAVLGCFAAQSRPPSLHEISQSVTTETAAATAEHPGQQLRNTTLANGVGATSASDPELGREDRRPRPLDQPQRTTSAQGKLLCAACAHAGTASKTKACCG